ncbi:MAG TPA: hypothetical protein VHZ31_08870 [Solirubrobacteraceae bacterium]|jgi:hypothetical protein|nr:hypothetical protein [Solirubrobacteraceae bacterium]
MTVETSEFPPMMDRLAAAWSRRVATGDTYDLAEMIELSRTFEQHIATAIHAARAREARRNQQPGPPSNAWSWTAIAEAATPTGHKTMSKQAAHQRWRT